MYFMYDNMITRKSSTDNILHFAMYHKLRQLSVCTIVFRLNCCNVLALENSYQCQVCFLIRLCNASFSLLSRDSVNKFLIAISVNK